MKRLFVLGIALLALQGCSNFAANRYSMSMDNAVALKQCLKSAPEASIAVGAFTSFEPGLSKINCRGAGPVGPPDDQTFEEYIRKALVDELRLAECYSKDADVVITGHLEKIDFSSTKGLWDIVLKLSASSGETFKVAKSYDFDSSWVAETACSQTSQALMPAVQDLMNKIFKHPQFEQILLAGRQ